MNSVSRYKQLNRYKQLSRYRQLFRYKELGASHRILKEALGAAKVQRPSEDVQKQGA